jgi:K+-sensing histidine kinase KdpD
LPRVFADEGRVVQSLLGLMDNAARSDSSPMLSIKVSRARASTRQVAVEITDPQLEIREADREHMFHAFRPSFAPSGRRIAGLSLGTAMARALMRAQGGDVWFEGRPERGTTFVLTLPAGQEQPRS